MANGSLLTGDRMRLVELISGLKTSCPVAMPPILLAALGNSAGARDLAGGCIPWREDGDKMVSLDPS